MELNICRFQLHPNVDLEKIVTMCPINITGADFYGICSSAWNCAVRRLICNIQQGIKIKRRKLSIEI